jgi:hypothetical protein
MAAKTHGKTRAKPKAAKTTKPAKVAAPSAAGYSGTPLPQKLGIKEGSRVAVVSAPAGFAKTLGALPTGSSIASKV